MLNPETSEFIKSCKAKGISESVALMYWTNKKAKNGVASVYAICAEEMEIEIEEARQLLLTVWQEYQRGFIAPVQPENPNESHLAFAKDYLQKLIGEFSTVTPKRISDSHRDNNILIGSDLHGIWADPEAVAAFLDYAEFANEVWLAGDILDLYALSRFNKNIDHITTRDELSFTRSFLEDLSKRAKKVKLIRGNHDNRGSKMMANQYPQMLPFVLEPVELLISGLPNMEMVSHYIPSMSFSGNIQHNEHLGYLGIDNDLVVSHHEKFAGSEAAEGVFKFISGFKEELGIKQNITTICQAHTHRLQTSFLNGVQLILTGSLCKNMPYQLEHGTMFKTTRGFVSLERGADGLIDHSCTRLIPV